MDFFFNNLKVEICFVYGIATFFFFFFCQFLLKYSNYIPIHGSPQRGTTFVSSIFVSEII